MTLESSNNYPSLGDFTLFLSKQRNRLKLTEGGDLKLSDFQPEVENPA